MLSDEQLVINIQAGDKAAFTELVTRHSQRYYQLAYRYLHSKQEAEDIVQTAFLQLWEKPYQWHLLQGAKFKTWFYRVIINLALDRNKKKLPQPVDDPDNHIRKIHQLSPVEKQVNKDNTEKCVIQAINNLPARQQTALNLCFYEQLSHKEAAEIMKTSISAVDSLLMRAKKNLYIKLIENKISRG